MFDFHGNKDKKGLVSLEKYRVGRQAFTPISLGVLILLIFCGLTGCGSDNPPKVSSPKKQEGAKSIPPPAAVMMGGQKIPGMDRVVEELPPGLTEEKLIARQRAEREKMEQDPSTEVLPGLTLREYRRLEAEEKQRKVTDPRLIEVAPGLTLEELNTRQAAERKRLEEDPSNEVAPGLTLEKWRELQAAEKREKLGQPVR